jgi:hypothetical protein
MQYYRVNVMDVDGNILASNYLECKNDEFAIIDATRGFPGQPVEIWQGARCVLANSRNELCSSESAMHRPVNLVV